MAHAGSPEHTDDRLTDQNESMSPIRKGEDDVLLDAMDTAENMEEYVEDGIEFVYIQTDLSHVNTSGFVTQYDGREVFIREELLVEDQNQCGEIVSPRLRDCLIEFIDRDEYRTLPANWLSLYSEMQRGLNVHEGFRRAVFDCEVAYRQKRLPTLPIPIRNADAGITGVDLGADILFREPEKGKRPQSTEDWEKLAKRKKKTKLYTINVDEMDKRVAESDGAPNRRNEIIGDLIREGKQVGKPFNPQQNREPTEEEERTRLAAIKEGKRVVDKSRKKLNVSSGTETDSSEQGEFQMAKKRQSRKQERKTYPTGSLKVEPSKVGKVTAKLKEKGEDDESQPMDLGGEGKGSATKVGKKLPKKTEPTTHQAPHKKTEPTTPPVPHKKTEPTTPLIPPQKADQENEPTGSNDEGEGDEKEEPKVVTEAEKQRLDEIHKNAQGEFKEFIPSCFEECAKGAVKYGCPGIRNLEGESDDEDWMRPTVNDPLPSDHYEQWFQQISRLPGHYYSRDQRTKLGWAYKEWCVENGEVVCPFSLCWNKRNRQEFSTPRRFVRHLVEHHMHHAVVYECQNTPGTRVSEKCDGCATTRRSTMIRHYKSCHTPGMKAAVERVNGLHELMMSAYNQLGADFFRKIDTLTMSFCEVSDAKNGKLSARVALLTTKGKFDMPSSLFDRVIEWRGDPPRKHITDKRVASQSPQRGDDKRSRDESPATFKKPVGREETTQYQSPLNRRNVQHQAPGSSTSTPRPGSAWSNNESVSSETTSGFSEDPYLPENLLDKTHGLPKVQSAPMQTVPDNRHKFNVRPVSHFFDNDSKVECESAQKLVDEFQEAQKELAVRYHQSVANLFAESVISIQSSQVAKLSKEGEALLATGRAEIEKERLAIKGSTALLRKRIASSEERNENMNVKFMGVFGVLMEDWDGTREGAIKLLEEQGGSGTG